MDKAHDAREDESGGEAAPRLATRAKKMIVSIIQVLVLAYAGVLVLGLLFQGKFIFPASRHLARTPTTFQWPFEDVRIPVGEHTTHGWYIPKDEARGVVLFSHGNAGNMGDRLESIWQLRALGFSVLAYDYGGYGESTGRPSEERCYADIRAMWRWLTEEKGVPAERVVLFGRSLGGGPTADLAREVACAAVVLESSFLSIREVARDMMRWVPLGFIIRHRFENQEKVGEITSPLLIIHSPDDSLIPFRHGQGLYERATPPKHFLEIRGDHNEGFIVSEKAYLAGWRAFLDPLLPAKEIPDQST